MFSDMKWSQISAIIVALALGVVFLDEVVMSGNFEFFLWLIPSAIVGWLFMYIGIPIVIVFLILLVVSPFLPIILFAYIAYKIFE